MSEVEALRKVITELRSSRDHAALAGAGWTAWGILNCKIADLELALLLRKPEEKKGDK